MTSVSELDDFLARLSARRQRLSTLAQYGRVRDAEELFDEVAELGEQLLVADEELRAQQASLDDARRALEVVAVRNEELFEAAATAYVVTDLDGHIVTANRAAAKLFADTPARSAVRPIATRFAITDRPTIRSMINQADVTIEPRAGFTSEAAVLRPGGATVPVSVSVRPDHDLRAKQPRLLWELVPKAAPALRLVGDSDAGLMGELAELAQELAEETVPVELLDRVVERAVAAVPGAEHAGVSLLSAGRRIETPAASSPLAAECDRAQYELGEGPCLQAIDDERGVLTVADMRLERRWPRFAARAAELGVHSLLACQLSTRRGTLGALNLYAGSADAFDADSVLIGTAFAAHAAIALAHVDREANLRRAIDSRETIGQAMGILMERYRLSAGGAFELLVAASHRGHVKLRELARRVVETGEDPV